MIDQWRDEPRGAGALPATVALIPALLLSWLSSGDAPPQTTAPQPEVLVLACSSVIDDNQAPCLERDTVLDVLVTDAGCVLRVEAPGLRVDPGPLRSGGDVPLARGATFVAMWDPRQPGDALVAAARALAGEASDVRIQLRAQDELPFDVVSRVGESLSVLGGYGEPGGRRVALTIDARPLPR